MSDDPILAALGRLEAGQAQLRTGLEAAERRLMERFNNGEERILNQITLIRDDIAVNMGGVDAARQANDNTRADVTQIREQMSVMWKQIKQLESRVRDITGEP